VTIAGLDVTSTHAFSYAFATGVEENGTLFAAVGGRGCETAGLGRETPFLDVGFNEDKAHLAKVDVDLAWAICAYCGKEVLSLEAVGDVVEFLAVSGEEKGACSGSVADADDVSLYVGRTVGRGLEGLVVSAVSVGHV
jgi:hypothetical protein